MNDLDVMCTEKTNFYSTKQVSLIPKVSESTVKRWIDAKIIAQKTQGGHRRVLSEDLLNFIKKSKIKINKEYLYK